MPPRKDKRTAERKRRPDPTEEEDGDDEEILVFDEVGEEQRVGSEKFGRMPIFLTSCTRDVSSHLC